MAALRLVQKRQVVESRGGVGMLVPKGHFGFLERGFEARRGAAAVTLAIGRLPGLHVRLPLGFARHGAQAAAGQPQQQNPPPHSALSHPAPLQVTLPFNLMK
ncbi:hypothetical protein [Candidatus Accumulibacter vicinus]|uniref:hypothetical protein n=1 Tax=Candidatus Accumulibacter vicinus TaxID=2954382 RepID=UPI00235B63D8|nr:hypothetical protein [Candidatus Accumulibacter vicinus]